MDIGKGMPSTVGHHCVCEIASYDENVLILIRGMVKGRYIYH